MKAVIDTNCLLSCIGKKSPYRNIFDAFLNEHFTLCVNHEILLEYEEIFMRFWGKEVTDNLLALFETSNNFEQVQVFYNFDLIEDDKDNNKFIDTYFASAATILVSNDNSITRLKNISFPPITILTIQEFSEVLKSA
jgi:putative PIN family toxin of toxin-antitoxin system